jgi:hypothetical protein
LKREPKKRALDGINKELGLQLSSAKLVLIEIKATNFIPKSFKSAKNVLGGTLQIVQGTSQST